MILPIVAYGDPILRKIALDIDPDYQGLDQLLIDMYETMEKCKGVGLAAPQINKAIRLFVIDSTKMYEDDEKDKGLKEVFINAQIVEEKGAKWGYEEGCLSIPTIREDVMRKPTITIKYLNAQFEPQLRTFEYMTARVIQHEYDHIEGILFIDHIKPLRKTLIKSKLAKISKGEVDVSYRMRYPK
jgi:peptide deformylase